MSNVFPSMISNEPPPLDSTSDEDDSEEFRTPGLKLDLFSAEPSPMSTPRKSATVVSPDPALENCLNNFLSASSNLSDHLKTNGHEESITNNSNSDYDYNVNPNVVTDNENVNTNTTTTSGNYLSKSTTSSDDSPQDEFKDCPKTPQTSIEQSEDSSSPPSNNSKSFEDVQCDEIPTVNSEQTINEDSKISKCALSEEEPNISVDVNVNCDSSISCEDKDNVNFTSTNSDVTVTDCNIILDNVINCEDDHFEEACDLDGEILEVNINKVVEESKVITSTVPCEILSHKKESEDEEEEYEDFQDFHSQELPELTVKIPEVDNIEQPDAVKSQVKEEEEDDDFGDFETSDIACVQAIQSPVLKITTTIEDNKEIKTSYIGKVEDEDDDDFGDFSSTAVEIPVTSTNSSNAWAQRQDSLNSIRNASSTDDDFADFNDFKQASTSSKSQPSTFTNLTSSSSTFTPRSSVDFTAAIESKFETLLKSVMPLPETKSPEDETLSNTFAFSCIDKELKESVNPHWAHIQDFEDSKGLLYKWLNSFCQQQLYKSLRIDSSTIVYTEKWGAIEVPRFAASMVETPLLQPQVCPTSSRYSDPDVLSKSKSSNSEDSPPSLGKKPLSKEAQQILQQMPDLSFMTAKTLVFPQKTSASSSSNSLL